MSIPITSLEKWHYKRECQIFSDLYKATGKTAWIRIPALIATEKCALIRTSALIGVIAGLTFNGLRFTISPYQSPEQRQHGWVLLKNVPSKGLSLLGSIIFGIVIGPTWISIDAEHYILENTERAKVGWKHADRDTIDSEDHKYDLEGAISEGNTGRKKWKNQLENPT